MSVVRSKNEMLATSSERLTKWGYSLKVCAMFCSSFNSKRRRKVLFIYIGEYFVYQDYSEVFIDYLI